MRIGIATLCDGNYGSILQAHASCLMLKSMGHDPVLIRFDLGGGVTSKLKSRVRILGFRRASVQYMANVRGHISVRSHHSDLVVRSDAMGSFVRRSLPITERGYTRMDYGECLQEAEVFLCGSDQVWNPAVTCYSPFYWLSFVPEDVPKIAYAPSMGMPKMSAPDKEFVVAQLNSFQDVSVRERATADMLNSLGGLRKHVETVVDPTLLVGKKSWEELADSSPVSQECEPYAFAYILRGSPEQRAFCSRLARSRGLRLVVYPYLEAVPQGRDAQIWGDERIFDDDPADFLARIRGASLVVTDSFHCTLFSILFHREFYVLRKTFDTSSQRTRIDEILAVARLEGRVLEHLEDRRIESDFAAAEARLAEHAESSRLFLEGAVARASRRVGRFSGAVEGDARGGLDSSAGRGGEPC